MFEISNPIAISATIKLALRDVDGDWRVCAKMGTDVVASAQPIKAKYHAMHMIQLPNSIDFGAHVKMTHWGVIFHKNPVDIRVSLASGSRDDAICIDAKISPLSDASKSYTRTVKCDFLSVKLRYTKAKRITEIKEVYFKFPQREPAYKSIFVPWFLTNLAIKGAEQNAKVKYCQSMLQRAKDNRNVIYTELYELADTSEDKERIEREWHRADMQ